MSNRVIKIAKRKLDQQVGHNHGTDIEDWQRNKSLQERMLHAYSNNYLADVVLLAGENKEQIKAHKYVLCISSPTFAQMFHGPFAQANEKETIQVEDKNLEVIHLPHMTFKTLNCVLTYIYSEKVQLEVDNVFNVLDAAKQYFLDGLEKECVQFLGDVVDAENVCYILEQALLYENKQLVKTCDAFISFTANDVIDSEDFKNLGEQTLCHILQIDTLQIEEWTLFKKVLKWADFQCVKKNLSVTPENKRQVLGNALYAIRFPAMNLTPEFTKYLNDKKNCILSESVCKAVLSTFPLEGTKLNGIPFNHKPRGNVSSIGVAIHNSGSYPKSVKRIEKNSIGFIIKMTAGYWLTGFGIYGTSSRDENVDLTISIEKDEKVISREEKKRSYQYGDEQRVNLTRPVAIYPGARYILNVKLDYPHYCYYYESSGTMTNRFSNPQTNEKTAISFFDAPNSDSDIQYGAISKLYFGI